MKNRNATSLSRNGAVYNRYYTGFRGLSAALDESAVGTDEFSEMENMYRDYGSSDARSPETAPGYRRLWTQSEAVRTIFPLSVGGEQYVGVQAGTRLYRFPFSSRDSLDTAPPTLLAEGLIDRNGQAVAYKNATYFLNGEGGLFRLTDAGCDRARNAATVPTVYLNGAPYRERNLLTTEVREEYVVGDPGVYATEGSGFVFEELPNGECCLVAVRRKSVAAVTVPATATVNGERRTVTAIGENAFLGAKMFSLRLPDTIRVIGRNAFRSCQNLTSLVLPEATEVIGRFAFSGCSSLSSIYCGRALHTVGAGAFHGCHAVTAVAYALSEEDLADVTDEVFADASPSSFHEIYTKEGVVLSLGATPPTVRGGACYFPLYSGMESGGTATLDGTFLTDSPTPIFPGDEENILPGEEIAASLNLEVGTLLHFFAWKNGNFYAEGSAESDVDFAFLTLSDLPAGTYRLTGTPVGSSGRLFAEVKGQRYTDTGEGTVFPLSETAEVRIGFAAAKGAGFLASEIFRPTLLRAAGVASSVQVYGTENGAPAIVGVEVSTDDLALLAGRRLSVWGNVSDLAGEDFTRNTGYTGSLSRAVEECTLAAVYDGRLFLAGNPRLPHTVFYSDTSPKEGELSFGAASYFVDEATGSAVTALIPAGRFLAVATADGRGSRLFLHTGSDTGEDVLVRVYPLSATAEGLPRITGAASYFGDALLFSERGILRLDADTDGILLFSVSGKIDLLLGEKQRALSAFATAGDLFWLSFGDGEVFLLDRRLQDSAGYTAYRLSGIGAFHNDREAAEYAEKLPEGAPAYFCLKGKPGALAEGSPVTVDGFSASLENGVYYATLAYGERTGGEFLPATAMGSVSDLLFFGTEGGDLLLFNTDLRRADGSLPARAYSFMGHRYRSGCATRSDNCGVPHLAKNTLRRSAVLKTRFLHARRLLVGVRSRTDVNFTVSDILCGGEFDFGDVNFGDLFFADRSTAILPLSGASRRYAETQYSFYTEGFCDRFSPTALSFRFTIGGSIKNEYRENYR